MVSFLHTFDITNVVKNQKILEKFRVEEILVKGNSYLKLTKRDNEENFLLLTNTGNNQNLIWNILGEEFFPSSVSILNKVIKLAKEIVESYSYSSYPCVYRNFITDDPLRTSKDFINWVNYATQDGLVVIVVLKFFSYKSLKFNAESIPNSYLLRKSYFRSRMSNMGYSSSNLTAATHLFYRQNPQLVISQEDRQSPIYQAFIRHLLNGKFDKNLFESVLLLFRLSKSNEELSWFLNSLTEEEDDLVVYLYNSPRTHIFTRGSLEKELLSGEEISHSSFSWLEATKKRNFDLGSLTRGRRRPVNTPEKLVTSVVSSVNKVKSLAQEQTNPEKWLSSNASEHYNKEVVPSYYWDLVES